MFLCGGNSQACRPLITTTSIGSVSKTKRLGVLHQSLGEMAGNFTDGFCKMCNDEDSFSIDLISHLKTNKALKKTEKYDQERGFTSNQEKKKTWMQIKEISINLPVCLIS